MIIINLVYPFFGLFGFSIFLPIDYWKLLFCSSILLVAVIVEKLLLEGVYVGDALLRAIDIGLPDTVKTICEFADSKEVCLNSFQKSHTLHTLYLKGKLQDLLTSSALNFGRFLILSWLESMHIGILVYLVKDLAEGGLVLSK